MPGILAGADVEGQVEVLIGIFGSQKWKRTWDALSWSVEWFPNVGLADNTPDDQVWELCQRLSLVLITGNRNARGAHSLQATIAAHNAADKLPVVTIGNAKRLMKDRDYAARAAEKLLDFLTAIEDYRGVGGCTFRDAITPPHATSSSAGRDTLSQSDHNLHVYRPR